MKRERDIHAKTDLEEKILRGFQKLTEEEKMFILAGLIDTLSEPAAYASDPLSEDAQAPSA